MKLFQKYDLEEKIITPLIFWIISMVTVAFNNYFMLHEGESIIM